MRRLRFKSNGTGFIYVVENKNIVLVVYLYIYQEIIEFKFIFKVEYD